MNETNPAGRIKVTITWLEMTRKPAGAAHSVRNEQLCILRARHPTVSYYRYLYCTVGEPWLWYERRMLDDHALSNAIDDERISIYVLYCSGVPAGYVELNRGDDDVEIAYFGLVPDFIGRGLGQYFLRWSIDKAWEMQPQRLLVNTCSLDHPRALAIYQRNGFQPIRQESRAIVDPRLDGTMPAGAAPHIPMIR